MTPEEALKTLYNAVRQINTTAENHETLRSCYDKLLAVLAELEETRANIAQQ